MTASAVQKKARFSDIEGADQKLLIEEDNQMPRAESSNTRGTFTETALSFKETTWKPPINVSYETVCLTTT